MGSNPPGLALALCKCHRPPDGNLRIHLKSVRLKVVKLNVTDDGDIKHGREPQ